MADWQDWARKPSMICSADIDPKLLEELLNARPGQLVLMRDNVTPVQWLPWVNPAHEPTPETWRRLTSG